MYIENKTKYQSGSLDKGSGAYIHSVSPFDHHREREFISIQVIASGRAPWVRIHPDDLVAALKDHPGLTISYEAPKRKNVDVVRDLPAGSTFRWDDMKPSHGFYIRQAGDRVIDTTGHLYGVKDFNHSEDGAIVVIYNPEDDSE